MFNFKFFVVNALLLMVVAIANGQITVNLNTKSGPDVTYLRGMGRRIDFEANAVATKTTMDLMASRKMGVVSFNRNLFKDASLGEFYKENEIYKNKQSDAFTNVRKYANDKGLVVFNQIGGTPDNSSDPLYPLSTEYYAPEEDWVPLPVVGNSMTEFQRNFVEWAINADLAIGPDFKSIWMGSQEPTHTLGTIGPLNDTKRELNVRRFIDYWKPIAEALRASGRKVCGVQLPSGASRFFQYAVDYLKQQNVEVDFLTYQFYQWGKSLDVDDAMDALNSYREKYPNAKMVVVRGHWHKLCCDGYIKDADATSAGMIYYLKGEKAFMKYADKIYAHMYDNEQNSSAWLHWNIHKWLNNNQPIEQRSVSNRPTGIDGFATSNSGKFQLALWNTATTQQTLTIQLQNNTYDATSVLEVYKASGETYVKVNDALWDKTTNTIKNISINQDEIILVSLVDPTVLSIKTEEYDEANILVFPNPTSNMFNVTGVDSIKSLSLFSMDGKLVKRQLKSSSISVEKMKPGMYLLKIETDDIMPITRKVFVK